MSGRALGRVAMAAAAGAFIAGSALVAPATAGSDYIDCTQEGVGVPNGWGGFDVGPQTFEGDVLVPNQSDQLPPGQGAFCVFIEPNIKGNLIIEKAKPGQGDSSPGALIFGAEGARIEGNVGVGKGAYFQNFGATIDGNAECDRCDFFEVSGVDFLGNRAAVHGNVSVHKSASGAVVSHADVDGNVRITKSHGSWGPVAVRESSIEGNVTVSRNTSDVELEVRDNTIDGNLTCKRNAPAPDLGSGNEVNGNTKGQCRN